MNRKFIDQKLQRFDETPEKNMYYPIISQGQRIYSSC
jgi:hypothetical protein